MNIEYCREFIELAQCLNFTEAAGNLNITQPALSKHMQTLEREFGVCLLARSKKNVQLTEDGRILFESAGIIVSEYDKTRELFRQLKAKRPIHVVGHMEDSDVATLASITAMLAREDEHTIIVFDRTADNPFDLLMHGTVDLFIGYVNPRRVEEAGFRCVPFITNQLLAIVSTTHPFAERTSVTWSDLSNQTFVKFMSDKTNPAWEQIEFACVKQGFTPKTRPVSAGSDVEFFSTPLQNDVLVWKKTQKQIGLLLEMGKRSSVPIVGDDRDAVVYAVYRSENEERLDDFFATVKKAKNLLDQRKNRKSDHICIDPVC